MTRNAQAVQFHRLMRRPILKALEEKTGMKVPPPLRDFVVGAVIQNSIPRGEAVADDIATIRKIASRKRRKRK